ncbi:MAG: S8 family serine peptidase [Ignavibacteriales bacterium]
MRTFKRYISKLIIAAILLTGVSAFNAVSVDAAESKPTREKVEILIKYKDENKINSIGSTIKSKLKLSKFNMKKKHKKIKMELMEIGENDNINNVIEELKKDTNIQYATPNYLLHTKTIPSDEHFAEQWALSNTGQSVGSTEGRTGVDINVLPVWYDNNITGSATVRIGLLDTGVDQNHPDLAEAIDKINAWDFVNGDNTVYDSVYDDAHGTQMAGIIVAQANEIGIRGVAPDIKLLPLKFMSGSTGYTSDAIDAINYAVEKGIKIINCSFGSTENNPALKDAMVNSGILFICAAGNEGESQTPYKIYPAAYDIDNVISVGAMDNTGILAPFSSRGTTVDIAAPGIGILTTNPESTYETVDGTSAAAAYVTGIAGLLKSAQPELDISDIKSRILNNVKVSNSLQGKVSTNGRVDANAVITNTVPVAETDGPGDDSIVIEPIDCPETGDGLQGAMDEGVPIEELIHFGQNGIDPVTGNFSFTCNDLYVETPGVFKGISRNYNSRTGSHIFSFMGNIKESNPYRICYLPDGSTQVFIKDDWGKYIPEKNTSILTKDHDGYTLITKDKTEYRFEHKKLISIKDRYGNMVRFDYDEDFNKVILITDSVGREYTLQYDERNRIEKIFNTSGNFVKYGYIGRTHYMNTVTDSKGNTLYYEYDDKYLIKGIKEKNLNIILDLDYYTSADNIGRVKTQRDVYGNVYKYTYNKKLHTTTITDSNNRKWTYEHKSYYVSKQTYPDQKYESFKYNSYGEMTEKIDRYSNKTTYERDNRGNVLKITNPDNSFKTFTYDDNNIKTETDENGYVTEYNYDSSNIKLLNKRQYFKGESQYAETSYEYYPDGQSNSLAKALVWKVTNPEGKVTEYTYDALGNIKTEKSPEGKVTTYDYTAISQKKEKRTPGNNITEYKYDIDGQLERETANSLYTNRILYDEIGRKIQEISPKQYDSTKDDIEHHTYSDLSVGTRYTYYKRTDANNVTYTTGKVATITDAENNTTTCTYDIYGNLKTEEKPNGAVYTYYYDEIDRPIRKTFKEDDNASTTEKTLEEYFYDVLSNKNTTKTVRKYYSEASYADTVYTYDYAERLVEQLNADRSRIINNYNANGTLNYTTTPNGTTYYKYDGMNRLSEIWTPFELVNNVVKYAYTKTEYYNDSQKKTEYAGKETVEYEARPSTFVTTEYTYYRDGKVHTVTHNSGAYTEYAYDDDGSLSMEKVKVKEGIFNITEYENNYLGKPLFKHEYVRAGDLFGNTIDNNADQKVTTAYTYDKDGNLETETDANEVTATYTYDNLNRVKTVTQPGVDENNANVNLLTAYEYNWEGKKSKETDPKNNKTEYHYNKRGMLFEKVDAKTGTAAYEYDLAGRLIKEVSPKNYISEQTIDNMNHTEYEYDNMDRVKTKTEKYTYKGQAYTTVAEAFKYDQKGNVTKELDALGYLVGTGTTDEKIDTGYGTEYTYNLAGKVTKTRDPVTKERNLAYTDLNTYDVLGRIKTKRNSNDVITTYYYDDAGNITSTTVKKSVASPEKTIMSAEYDKIGNATVKIDGNGNRTTYEYNFFNKVRKTIEPGDNTTIPSNTTIYQYDKVGNLKKQADDTGLVKQYTYDNQRRVLKSTEQKADESEAITIEYRYDKNGNKAYEKDGKGYETTKTYDELNRLHIVTDAKNHPTIYEYDANGNLTTTTDWRLNTYTSVYDPLNRLVEKSDPYNVIQRLEYYPNGMQQFSYDANNKKTEFKYDKNNRLISTIDPLGDIVSQEYDNVGNIKIKKDGMLNPTTYYYDEFNRLSDVINAKDETTSYTYDMNGNMLSQKDGKGNISYYEYNVANKLIKRIDAEGRSGTEGNYLYNPAKTETYTYYADKNLATRTDRNGKTTNYTYDIHGHLRTESIGNISISYDYDNNANLEKVTDATGETKREYDELNRTISKDVPGIGVTHFEYDIITGVEPGCYAEKTTDPKGNLVTKVYDKAGRLFTVTSDGKTATYQYYPDGSKWKVTYDNGASEEYTYYDDKLLDILVNKKADGTIIESYKYTYDDAHNLKTKNDIKGETKYDYDELNRLKKVNEQDVRITDYTFDKAGNRITETVTQDGKSTVTIYKYNEQNRLMKTVETKSAGESTTTKFTYDNNGNLLREAKEEIKDEDPLAASSMSVTIAGEEQGGESYVSIYEYDELNQLVKSQTGSKLVVNSYDGEGTRVTKEVNGDITRFLYEGRNVILETDGTGNEKAHNVHGTNLLSRTTEGQTADYFYNGHGDVTLLLDENGQQLASYYYDAFGNPTSVQESVYNPYRYAGYMWDEETGKYYLMARMYDPVTARFMQEDSYRGDTKDPLSLNLYTYCHNEPLMYTDPDGHDLLGIATTIVNIYKAYTSLSKPVQKKIEKKLDSVIGKGNTQKIVKTVQTKVTQAKNIVIDKITAPFKTISNGSSTQPKSTTSTNNKADNQQSSPPLAVLAPIAEKWIENRDEIKKDYLGGIKKSAIDNKIEMYEQVKEHPISTIVFLPYQIMAQPITSDIDFYNRAIMGDMHEKVEYAGEMTEQLAEIFLFSKIAGRIGKTGGVESFEGTVKTGLPTEAELNGAVSEWSRMQKSLASSISKRKVDGFNTGSVVYDAATGKYYYGMNKGIKLSGDTLNKTLADMLPEKSLNGYPLGNCAEVDAVNQALNNKANLNDLYIYTIETTPNSFGVPKPACENCTATFLGKAADILSGHK